MADDFGERLAELADGENRLAELFQQVTSSLDALVEKSRRLSGAFDASGSTVGAPRAARSAAVPGMGTSHPAPGASPAAVPSSFRNPASQQGREKAIEDNTKANLRTAAAVEDLVRNGVKLRDPPPAVYGE